VITRSRLWQTAVLGCVLLYLTVPVLATVRFAFSVGGRASARPVTTLVARPEFWPTLGRSTLLATLTVLCALVLTVPALVVVRLRLPRLRPVVEVLALLPFVIPGVILALGLFGLYGAPPLLLTGSPAVLVVAYVITALPLMVRSVDNALEAIDARTLTEAAESLGAGFGATLWRVLLPNLKGGLIAGSLLTFAIAFGEFTLANLLVGAAWKTFPVFMRELPDGHEQSGIAVISFVLTFIISGAVLWAGGRAARVSATGAVR
jgi:putative spermidine/putrescine transport system permease protein